MNTTAVLAPAHPRKINFHPLQPALGKAGRTIKRALDGAAWGAGSGSLAGAVFGMAILAWSLNIPFGKLCAEIVSALIILVVVATLGGLSVLAFALLRAGLRWLYTRPGLLRWIAVLPYGLTWLLPLPLIFAVAGIILAGQLYAWFPQVMLYFHTLQGPIIPIILIEAVLGMLAGIVLAFRPRHRIVPSWLFCPPGR